MLSSDLTGVDAFDNVMERLLSAEQMKVRAERERDELRHAKSEAERDQGRLQSELLTLRPQVQKSDKILEGANRTLIAVRDYLRGAGIVMPPEITERLKKAIEDTDEIPF